MHAFFGDQEFEIIKYESEKLYFGFHYIDTEKLFFNHLLILSNKYGTIKEVFRIEQNMITDYWSKNPQQAPKPKDFIFFGYQIIIEEDMTIKLSVFKNESKNSIKNARIYFWRSEKEKYEPLY